MGLLKIEHRFRNIEKGTSEEQFAVLTGEGCLHSR